MGFSLSLNIGKKALGIATGDLARQANGSVCASYGDTVVLATVCMSREAKNAGFLPLVVEYQEKTYAMGKIPGGFIKREGRPKDAEILCARLIDRPLRPLFPKELTNEIQIVAMVLSSDGENDPDVLAVNAASAALLISDIPFNEPVGAVRVVKVGDEFIVNPSYTERENASLSLIVVGTENTIIMIEADVQELDEKEVLDAIKFSHPHIKEIIKLQKDFCAKVGKPKRNIAAIEIDKDLVDKIKAKVSPDLEKVYGLVGKEERENALAEILSSLCKELKDNAPDIDEEAVKNIFFAQEEEFMRRKIIKEGKRPDSRSLQEIRPINCQVTVLPRTHGSAVFTRGQTQSLAITTLGTASDEQRIEALGGEISKRFMLHYLFPPFSVGEVKAMRGVSRREIGHGALAERALSQTIPSKEEFPYTIRIVSEILESNGSSSMATVCASSLSLMDAGVPIKAPVAGIAMGLVTDGDDYRILTDIAGIEDHYGDMDFKIAGTKKGITAIQLDTKIAGISYKMIEDTFQQAKVARCFILDKMAAALASSRQGVSQYAPKIKTFEIDPDKIGAVIGPGGKMIRRLCRENNVNIDIDDDTSTVAVVAVNQEDLDRAVKQVLSLVREVEVGDVYTDAEVVRIVNFGAFCEIAPGKQGLVHVSEISDTFIKDVTSVLKEGDIVTVKVIGIDAQGRINLSIKQAK